MVLLESRSGRGLESNIFVILQELNKKEYEDYPVILAVRKGYESGVWEKLKHYGLKIDKMFPLEVFPIIGICQGQDFSSMILPFPEDL